MPKRGPKTASGRAAVRFNAVKHGIFSHHAVVPGLESDDDWALFRQNLLLALAPEGAAETLLAEDVVSAAWRLRRVTRGEAQIIAVSMEHVERDYARTAAYGGAPESVAEAESIVEATRAGASLLRSIAPLDDAQPLPARVCAGILEAAAAGGDDLLRGLPGAPPDGFPADVERWTVGSLRGALAAMAGRLGVPTPALVETARERLELELPRSIAQVDVARIEIERLRRQRLLPEDRVLRGIARYEAHLARLFYRALHELEALQARRQGAPTPIARLQVHGLPGT